MPICQIDNTKKTRPSSATKHRRPLPQTTVSTEIEPNLRDVHIAWIPSVGRRHSSLLPLPRIPYPNMKDLPIQMSLTSTQNGSRTVSCLALYIELKSCRQLHPWTIISCGLPRGAQKEKMPGQACSDRQATLSHVAGASPFGRTIAEQTRRNRKIKDKRQRLLSAKEFKTKEMGKQPEWKKPLAHWVGFG